MKSLSNLLGGIPPSATIAVNDKAKALKAAGHDVISLAGGDPNFDTPVHIQEAAFAAIRSGNTHYPAPAKGTKPAIDAIIAKTERDTGITVGANEIIVTPGGKWAIYLALAGMLNPGDEVLYLEPVWVSYPPLIELAGGVPVAVSLPSDDNFRISAELLRAKVTSKTKAIMVTSPSNPTGRVCTREEIDAIVDIANEFDLFVIYDELYEKLLFDDNKHIALLAEPGMRDRTICINGLSKAYAMTGWRLGWIVAHPDLIKLAAKLHSQTVTSAASFGMTAIAAALDGPQDCVEEMRQAYLERRNFMVPALNSIDGIECANIEGAFYLFPKFTKTALGSLDIASRVLDAGVAGTPGIAFGSSGEGHLRFSIATAPEQLKRALDKLAQVVPTL
ncbi:MAG: pyridoxal phosphate-dependent aminotransferase [Anaerolineae bacterium]|nr:pyridoxal phosphate-dependent aminotransferase [Anaerolineae bacterium]